MSGQGREFWTWFWLVLWTADKQEMRFPSCCALCCKLTTAVWDHPTPTLNLCTTFFPSNALKKNKTTKPCSILLPTAVGFFFPFFYQTFWYLFGHPSPSRCAVYCTCECRKRPLSRCFPSLLCLYPTRSSGLPASL